MLPRTYTVAALLCLGFLTVPVTPAGAANVAESEPNATPATADALTANDRGTGALTPIADVDVWSRTGASVFDLVFGYADTSASVNSDSELEVVLADGVTVLEADSTSGPASSAAVAGAVVSQAGDVFLRVFEGGNDETLSPYALFQAIVSPTDTAAESEPNDTAAEASSVTASMMTGLVAPGDNDFFAFPVPGGTGLIVVIVDDDPDNDGVLTDTTVEIVDRDGATSLSLGDNLAGNDANATGPVALAAFGTYFVRITNGGASPDTDYRFVVLDGGAPATQPACCFPDGSCEEATPGRCAGVGGSSAPGNDCDTAVCSEPSGACCASDCSCSDEAESSCATLGGRFAGFGSACQAHDCGVSVFTEEGAFQAGAGPLSTEDFEELAAQPGIASGCGTPIPGSGFCFSAADIATGVRFVETDDTPAAGFVALTATRAGLPAAITSDILCGGDGSEGSFDVELTAAGIRAIGMQVLATDQRQIDFEVIGEGDLLLASGSLFTSSTGRFFGVHSDASIALVRFTSPAGGNNALCLDDVLFGNLADTDLDTVPESFACAGPCAGGATADCADNCPLDANADQADPDADGIGDACDLCPDLPDAGPGDTSLAGLACRAEGLAGAVQAETQLGVLQPKLSALAARALAKLGEAAAFCGDGDAKSARKRIKNASKALRGIARRLGFAKAVALVPEPVRLAFIADATELRTDALAALDSLLCPQL